MKNIFLFGECMIELMTASQEKSSSTIKQSFAGDVFNTAVYLKRTFSDIKVNLVTAVGKDNFSQKMVQYFEDEQIGTDLVFQSETKIPGLYSIQLDDKGERSFTYWRNDSAARQVMQHIDDQAISQLSEGDMFFFSGGVDDFEQLYGMTTSQEVYDFCKPYQFDELIIKNGEMGIICYLGDLAYEFFITPVDNVVDTTSAGDSFNGVYLGARANGSSLSEAIELASKSAAFVIQHHGAIVEPHAYQAFITELLN